MTGLIYDAGADPEISLVILDKDGTILDFNKTWLPTFKACAEAVAVTCGEPGLEPALLKAGGWIDGPDGPSVSPMGEFLHGTVKSLAQEWIDTQPIVASRYAANPAKLEELIDAINDEGSVRDAAPLGEVEVTLRQLRAAGVALAVVTNDQEATARRQLDRLGWSSLFQTIVGADSGYGPKPGAGGVRHCIDVAGVPARNAIMCGDALGDMQAGQNAGCAFTVALWPDREALPAGLATAACRMETIAQLPAALAAAGQLSLSSSRSSALVQGDAPATVPLQMNASAELAAAAAARVDKGIISMVQSSAPLGRVH